MREKAIVRSLNGMCTCLEDCLGRPCISGEADEVVNMQMSSRKHIKDKKADALARTKHAFQGGKIKSTSIHLQKTIQSKKFFKLQT